jgi:hypothetical protein
VGQDVAADEVAEVDELHALGERGP